jgi:nucleotide-binding universal stress UspA family protein
MFYEKIIIAVDDTLPSQYAIDVGIRIAERDGSPIVLAVALDPSLLGKDYGFASVQEVAEQVASEIIAHAERKARGAGVAVSSKIFFDDPADGIVNFATSEAAELIVIGTHGRTGIMRAITRSIAEEVLRQTTMPLCVVRRPAIGKIYNRVLAPITDDELWRDAVAYTTKLVRAFESSLLFCTVETSPDQKADIALLQQAQAIALEAGVASESVVIPRESHVAGCILKRARASECDIIVMPSHGRDGLSRLMDGSVAETVIRSSETPVLVIRASERAVASAASRP